MKDRSVPEATVGRLPVYLRALIEMAERGATTTSSEGLAEAAGVNSAKVRKDLSYLGSYGTRGGGKGGGRPDGGGGHPIDPELRPGGDHGARACLGPEGRPVARAPDPGVLRAAQGRAGRGQGRTGRARSGPGTLGARARRAGS